MDRSSRKRIWSADATVFVFELCFSKKYLKLFNSQNYLIVWEKVADEFHKKFPEMKHLKSKHVRQRFYRVIREFEIGRYGKESDRYFELKKNYFHREDDLKNMGFVKKTNSSTAIEESIEDVQENSDIIFHEPEITDYENYLNWVNTNINSKNLTYKELKNDLKILHGKVTMILDLLKRHFK